MTPADTNLRDTLLACRRDRSLVEMSAQAVPASAADGFDLQAAIVRDLGVGIGGWKVMIAGDAGAAASMAAPFFEQGGTYEGAPGAEVRIEIELALRLARDVPVRPGRPYERAELLDHCDRLVLGIEMVESRMANWQGVAFPLWLADSLGHGGYMVGPDLPMSLLDDLAGTRCVIEIEGETIYDEPAVHGNGDPMAPFLAWANRDHDRLGPLKAGHWVTTGSLCGGVLAPRRGRVKAALAPRAEVEFTLR